MEVVTAKNIANQNGVDATAIRRTLIRWHTSPKKQGIYTDKQFSEIKGLKNADEWPTWLHDIWCDNYSPKKVKPTEPDVPPTEPDVPPTEPDVPPTEPDVPPTEQSGKGIFELLYRKIAGKDVDIEIRLLIMFQAYIFARFATIVFEKIEKDSNSINFMILCVVGYLVDNAGLRIAKTLKQPKYKSDDDERKKWIWGFFIVQVIIDLCYLFHNSHDSVYIIGAVVIVISTPLGLIAYSRSKFQGE